MCDANEDAYSCFFVWLKKNNITKKNKTQSSLFLPPSGEIEGATKKWQQKQTIFNLQITLM
jgi:hypothetical protein